MCKYCDLNNKEVNAKNSYTPGLAFGNGNKATLCMVYDDCNTHDDDYHFQIKAIFNHVEAWAEIQYCPFCGRKLE